MHNVKPNKNDDKMMINIYIRGNGGVEGDIRVSAEHTLHLTERKPPQERARAAPSLSSNIHGHGFGFSVARHIRRENINGETRFRGEERFGNRP